MFLLVPAHPGFPGQIPQSRKTVVCVCVYIVWIVVTDNTQYKYCVTFVAAVNECSTNASLNGCQKLITGY